MAISDFWYFSILTAKIQNFDFSKIIAYKIGNFQLSQKTGIHVIEIQTNNKHTKFQCNIFVFACAMAKKPGKGDDVTF